MSAVIRRARLEEAPALRELAHRSKAYWPYDAAFLKAVAPMLILEPRHVEEQEVHVLELDGAVAGWHRFTFYGERAELEDLWLEPESIGSGHWRTLFRHAVRVARRRRHPPGVGRGARTLKASTAPWAERRSVARRQPPSPAGRFRACACRSTRAAERRQSLRITSPMRPKGGRGSA